MRGVDKVILGSPRFFLIFWAIIYLGALSPIGAQDPNQCAAVGSLIKIIASRGVPSKATRLGEALRTAGNVTGVVPPSESPIAGVVQDQQNDFANELGDAFIAKCVVQSWMRANCGCSIKGTPGPYQSPNTNSVASSPNATTLWFAGDSLTRGAEEYGSWSAYLPGYQIANIAVSGSTSVSYTHLRRKNKAPASCLP